MKPILYRWDDGNAPIARGERRSLVDILRACLVDGYGDKPAAGWTLEYMNITEDKAAFRNNPVTGTGFYLQVDGLSNAYAYRSDFQAFESMTSENDGLFPFNNDTAVYFQTSSVVGTLARKWILVADDRAFLLSCFFDDPASDPISNTHIQRFELMFGDIISYTPDDAFGCILKTSYLQYGFFCDNVTAENTAGNRRWMPRKLSGEYAPFKPALCNSGGPGGSSYPGQGGLPLNTGDPILISRPYLNDGAAYTLRGWLPMIWYPCHKYESFDHLETVEVLGKTYLVIRGYLSGGSPGCYLIALDDWRA